MNAELIAVGSELLRLGRRDTNGDWLTERIVRLGGEVRGRSLVEDDVGRIARRVECAIEQSDLVVITGGLGPTEDDRTRDALALALRRPLVRDPEMLERLRAGFVARGREFRSIQHVQADRPAGAEWVDNPLGTAPGLIARVEECFVVALPGVPGEMRRMFVGGVEPRVAAVSRLGLAGSVLHVGGRTESAVEERVRDLYATPHVEVTILSGRDGIDLGLRARGADRAEAERRLAEVEARFVERLGDDLYGRDDTTLAAATGEALARAGLTLAVSESCTGGMLGASITMVPGSSGWFRGGIAAYHDALKVDCCGVSPEILSDQGAVSEAVARALALGARERLGANLGVGITGVAGPGGGSPEKPVGRVHVALDGPRGTEHFRLDFIGDREQIRQRAVGFTLDRIRRFALAVVQGERS